jgi:cytochrome c peroxidase
LAVGAFWGCNSPHRKLLTACGRKEILVSRNVSIVNLDNDSVVRVLKTADPPLPGTQDEQLQVGKEIFCASRGVFDGGKVNRLSAEGWQNCASCHFAGLTDGNVWSFNAGPRKSVPLNGTWSPHNPDDQRLLNYSAIFDEVQDFEANIRNVSGPGNKSNGPPAVLDENHGLLIGDDGDIDKAPGVVNSFAKPNAARPQLAVTLQTGGTAWPALDALKEWVRFAVRTPNGPLSTDQLGANTTNGLDPNIISQGRRLFFRAGCQPCHGGTKWTISAKDFDSPPAVADIFCEVDLRAATPPVNTLPGCQKAPVNSAPVAVQFLNRFLRNVGSFGFNTGGIGALEKSTDNKDALGKDHNQDGRGNGYNVPSLLGIWALPPYYHNGGCETLACVLADPNHRAPGRPALSSGDQAQVAVFLQSLDAKTDFPTNLIVNQHDIFFDPPKVIRGSTTQLVGVNISLFGAKEDLTDLLSGGTLNVHFSGPGLNVDRTVSAADFDESFGHATVTVPWAVPNTTGRVEIVVQVDTGNAVPEAKENDNTERRRIFINGLSADRIAPVVTPGSVSISDDDPFDPTDPIATTREARVRFTATDSGSGLDSFCVVRYSYNTKQRRWVEENCAFQRLPEPDTGTTSTFTVDAVLPVRAGAAYAFVWVKDRSGNVSRRPELDVISFIPFGQNISVDRNDTHLFRVVLNNGQSASFTFTPSVGDIDVLVFKNGSFLSANPKSGIQAESVTISSSADGTVFQIEARAVVNSVFKISGTPSPTASAPAQAKRGFMMQNNSIA